MQLWYLLFSLVSKATYADVLLARSYLLLHVCEQVGARHLAQGCLSRLQTLRFEPSNVFFYKYIFLFENTQGFCICLWIGLYVKLLSGCYDGRGSEVIMERAEGEVT